MEAEAAKLNKGQEPMTPEKWETHRHCETASREHKWQWVNDPATGLPSPDKALCVHCGIETLMTRKDH